MCNAWLCGSQVGIKISNRSINNLRYGKADSLPTELSGKSKRCGEIEAQKGTDTYVKSGVSSGVGNWSQAIQLQTCLLCLLEIKLLVSSPFRHL